jgi:pimeloyl-ACP methyl ester carboxylesterase
MLAAAGCGNSGGPDAHAAGPKTSGPAEPVKKAPSADADGGAALPGQNTVTDKFRNYVTPKREPREMTLVSIPVADAPVIDGRADEPFWDKAPALTTLDYPSQRSITLRSVHAKGQIFFLVTFPEETPHETHKTWIWDPKEEVYREGPDREDVFVFKWSMSGNDVDLRLREPMPHRADIWFWKAHRTNPAGYVGCCHAIAALDLTERLGAIKLPTLVIVGEEDQGTPVAASRTIHEQIRGSELAILKSASHLSNLEQPEEFTRTLTAFLGRLG